MLFFNEGFRKQFNFRKIFSETVNLEQQEKSILRFHSSTLESAGAPAASERASILDPKDFSKVDNGMFSNTKFYIVKLKPSQER